MSLPPVVKETSDKRSGEKSLS